MVTQPLPARRDADAMTSQVTMRKSIVSPSL